MVKTLLLTFLLTTGLCARSQTIKPDTVKANLDRYRQTVSKTSVLEYSTDDGHTWRLIARDSSLTTHSYRIDKPIPVKAILRIRTTTLITLTPKN